MTTPNRPPVPDWYQAPRRVPPHIGPTQRELITRRIRSLRRLLIGASLVGVATFTTLAAYRTESKASAAVAQTTTTGVTQQSAVTTVSTSPNQSLFDNEGTSGFTAESRESEHASVASATTPQSATTASTAIQPAAASTTSSQITSSNAPATTTQAIPSQTTSRHRTRTASS